MTLLEITIAASLAAMITISSYGAYEAAARTARTTHATSALEQSGRRTLDRMARDFRSAAASQVAVGNGSVSLRPVIGAAGGLPAYGTTVTYTVVHDARESDNGVDDDGDGLMDEMEIVRGDAAGSVAIAVNVQEGSFSITPSGAAWQISFTLEALDADRRLVHRSFQTIVRPRN